MAAIGAISGTILPMALINAQNTAEKHAAVRAYLDSARHIAIIQIVGGLSPEAVFANEHRYPSPDERLLTNLWGPFLFFALSVLWRDRRGFAQIRALHRIDFDSDRGMAPCCHPNTFVEKGTTSCDASPWRSRFFWFSPLAARHLWSKPSSAPVRASALRRSSMATLPQGRPSARRATCSIVRRTPAAADLSAPKPRQRTIPSDAHWPGARGALDRAHWGASTERGAEYGQDGKSSDPVGSIGGVQRTRSVEPHGIRFLHADINHRIIAASGLAARITAPRPLTKRGPCLRVSAALLSFSIADRRNDRCSRRS